MEKEFLPYEVALSLKELGFNESCLGFYDEFSNNKVCYGYSDGINKAPTFSQAFRFFRDKKYQAEILWRSDFGDFCWKIGRFEYNSHFFSKDGFDTYEEARLECLKELIKIMLNKIKNKV